MQRKEIGKMERINFFLVRIGHKLMGGNTKLVNFPCANSPKINL